MARINSASRLLLFLDYDGTLTGFRKEPMEARPSQRIRKIVLKLADDPTISVTIVSGRDINSLMELFSGSDISKINLCGAHGIQMKFEDSDIIQSVEALPVITTLKNKVSGIIASYPCFSLEDKRVSFALHYRKCPDRALALLGPIKELIKKYAHKNSLEVLYMKKVIEIKPAGVNKGNSIAAIISHYGYSNDTLTICIGDDVTDEYLFRANTEGVNIKVGNDNNIETAAGYYLMGVGDVYWFLKKISCGLGQFTSL